MGRRSKHVTQAGLFGDVEAPCEGQRIVRAVGSRGGNIVEVEYPDGRTTLCLLPNKFNKTLWVKKGGFLLIEEAALTAPATSTQPQVTAAQSEDVAAAAQKLSISEPQPANEASSQQQATPSSQTPQHESSQQGSKVTGTILAILYDEQIKQLRKMPGVWPQEFSSNAQDSAGVRAVDQEDGLPPVDKSSEAEDSEEDGLPPLEQNTNRRVIVHMLSDSDAEGEED